MPRLVMSCYLCDEKKPISGFNIALYGSCCLGCIKKYEMVGDPNECCHCGEEVDTPRFYECFGDLHTFCVDCDTKLTKVNRTKYLYAENEE